jgi:hypothetical protein
VIKALFKFSKNIPEDACVVDTTLNSGKFENLSPFILSAPPAKRFENLWQYSKVYKGQTTLTDSDSLDIIPSANWYSWREKGFNDPIAHRYPMGKGAIPLFSYWNGKHLDYIQARKQIYIPEYIKNVSITNDFKLLASLYYSISEANRDLILLDYDAYDHQALRMTLKDVVNNPNRKCGHAFVLLSLLTGEEML